jgi:3-hydroxybutyryl-CoA dehydrogenase
MKSKLDQIEKFLVLGSGTLGLRVGLRAALSGFQVTIYDIDEKSLEKARHTQQKLLHHLISEGRVTNIEADLALKAMHYTTDAGEAAAGADFVNESVTENLEIKKQVWKQFSELCDSETVLTSNSSYMVPSMLTEVVKDPERFAHFHFHDVFFANVVDIMPHAGTRDEMIPLLKEMGLKLMQIPVVVRKENPGYIFNTMLAAVLGAAGQLVLNGVSSVEDVDRSWMGNFKMPIGPFGMMDEIGLETVWHVTSNLRDRQSQQFADFLKPYVDSGKLGIKTGEGFYSYPNPAYKNDGFFSSD